MGSFSRRWHLALKFESPGTSVQPKSPFSLKIDVWLWGAQDRLEAVRPFQRDEGNTEDDGEEDAAGRMRGTGGAEGEDSDDNWGFGDDNGGKGSSSGESSGERGGVVMLIALKAGGAGLNLPFASHVWMMEPHWNPYMEDQVRTDTKR